MFVTLASELTHKGIWYPTILGVLVVVAGIVLFCGSVYVLLGTNLGARLGFLVAFSALAGFMCILTLLWCVTASPLNTLKGRIPQWKVVDRGQARLGQAEPAPLCFRRKWLHDRPRTDPNSWC